MIYGSIFAATCSNHIAEMEVGITDLPAKPLCSVCNILQNTAIAYCTHCKESLCESCYTAHNTFKAMKHHHILKILMKEEDHGFESKEHCTEHMVKKRFYCRTCDAVICGECILQTMHCYDHQYITLKEAAREYKVQLNHLIHQCMCVKKRCQFAISRTKVVKDSWTCIVQANKDTIGNIKNEHIWMLEEIFAKFQSSISDIAEQRLQQLHTVKTHLVCNLDDIQKTRQLAKTITESSYFDIATHYTSLTKRLEDISNSEHPPADSTLRELKIQLPLVLFQQKTPWKPSKVFSITSGIDSVQEAVIHLYGGIGLISSSEFCILSRIGDVIHKISVPPCDGITTFPDGNYAIYNTIKLTVYTKEGKWVSNIFLQDAQQIPIALSRPVITTDPKGRMIAGSRSVIFRSRKPRISIHSQDGSFINSFITASNPEHLAATSNDYLVVTFADHTVQLVNYTGDAVRSITTPPQTLRWAPRDVCCGISEVYVVSVGEPTGVYFYTLSGMYLGQIVVDDLETSCRIGLSSDQQELVVWTKRNDNMVIQIFKRE